MNRQIKFKTWDAISEKMEGPFMAGEQFGHPSSCDLSILEYTGLEDSEGKEIYEGDILKFVNGKLSKVIFVYGCFWVKGVNHFANDVLHEWNDSYTVVGNIFENKGLLYE